MKRRLWPFFVPVVLFGAFLLYRNFAPQKTEYFVLEPRNLFETLVAAGRIRFSRELSLSFPVSGILQQASPQEGERVQRGELLAALEDSLEQNRLELARTELALAEINLRRIESYQRKLAEEEHRRATINLQAALEQYQKAQFLFRQGSIPEEELKKAERDWETALSLERTTRLNLMGVQEDGPVFLEAKAQVERARLELLQAEIDARRRLLYAPADGIVVAFPKNPGEFVQAGETVVVLGENPFQVVIRVDERQYRKIRPGMKALVREQADPQGEVLVASITGIAPAIDTAQGTVEVTLLFDAPLTGTKPNAAVNVEIILREEEGVLAFPKRYLADKDTVWVAKEGKAYPVRLLRFTPFEEWIQTTDLPPGTVLLPPRGLREGKRVVLGERSTE